MTELRAGQIAPDRHGSALARSLALAVFVGAFAVSGCSLLSGDDEPGAPADGTEAAAADGDETAPEFTPVAAEAPTESEVGRVTIVYPENNADLPEKVTAELDRLAEQLADRNDIRLELHAYAKGDEDEASRAKLYALKRGMRVRSHLHKQGVGAQRVVLRPLGIDSGDGPPDRVDVVLLQGLDPALQTRIASADSLGQSAAQAGPGSSEEPSLPGFEPVQPETAPADGADDDQAAREARLAQLQQPGAAPEADPDQSQLASEESEADGAPAVIPQGDALGDADEGSLVARFEAIAAADVQLAEDPGLQATIARKGGVLNAPDGDEDTAVPTQLAETPAANGEAAFVSRFSGTEAPALAQPQFNAVPNLPEDPANPAVSVARGEAFEAAMAGAAPEGATPPLESADAAAVPLAEPPAQPPAVATDPQAELQSVVVAPPADVGPAPAQAPNVAALPPAGTMTTDPTAGSRNLYLIQFEADSPDMTAEGRTLLRDAIEDIMSRPDTRVKIVARAEGSQDDDFLLALSTIRRNEVEGALRNSGVHWGRIWSKAVGDRKPNTAVADNNIVEIIIRQK